MSQMLACIIRCTTGKYTWPCIFHSVFNDLPSAISSSNTLIYADDTKYFKIIKTESDIPYSGKIWRGI